MPIFLQNPTQCKAASKHRTVKSLAAIADGKGGFVIDTVDVRAPLTGEVRVRLPTAGICHTDHASLN